MEKPRKSVFIPMLAIVLVAGVFLLCLGEPVSAKNDHFYQTDITTTPGTITIYKWWMLFTSDNSIACEITIEHDGVPTGSEILSDCGVTLHQKWIESSECESLENEIDIKACREVYLEKIDSEKIEEQPGEIQALPPIWLDYSSCTSDYGEGFCKGIPSIKIISEESPLYERVTSIEGELDGHSFSCSSSACELSLSPTDEQGVPLVFWGIGLSGETTEEYDALVRVIPIEESQINDGQGTGLIYSIEVVSTQWKGKQLPACATIWQVFPELNDSPDWLETPQESSDLNSTQSLYFLSAMLIQNGMVDASNCTGGGLITGNIANRCGMEMAANAAIEWQNQFDDDILQISIETGIPGNLLKNLFIRESQLWPGIFLGAEEVGLGQLTEEGAEAALLWNPEFYSEFCPMIYSQSTCSRGYGTLPKEQQAVLRGALVEAADASCTNCPTGVNLEEVAFSIKIFAETMYGNCAQVNRMMYNLTRKSAGELSTYKDLWRFTLINYNAGPGCLWKAMSRTWRARDPMDWDHLVVNLDPICRLAVDYVVAVSDGDTKDIVLYSTPLPTATPTRVRSATPTRTLTLTRTPTATRTQTATATETATATATLTETMTETPTLEETPKPMP